MIEIFIAIVLLGTLYVNKNGDTNKSINNKSTIEQFSNDGFPKKINGNVKKHIQQLDSAESFIHKNRYNKNTSENSLLNKEESKIENDEFIGSGSLLNPHTNIIKLTKENFLSQPNTGNTPISTNITKGIEVDITGKRGGYLLEKLTGRGKYKTKKTESPPFFKPIKDLGYIHGAPNMSEFEQSRMEKSTIRNGELPFEQVKVGPGLGEEYGNKPIGGFHQLDIHEIVRPKNIDQLRSKINQKITYKGLVIKGKHSSDKRVKLGKVHKSRPDKFYSNSEDRYFKTTGAYLKDSKRLNFDAKHTNREISKPIVGNAKTIFNKHKTIPNIKKSTRNLYKTFGVINKNNKNQWSSINKISDYGKHTFVAYANERDITQKRTYKSNFNTLVKAIVSPLLDKFKPTRKENAEGNIRPEGNIGISIPQKLTVHDSNDIAKTTIKETLIHNKREGNISVHIRKNKKYKYDTLPKITIRNTLKETDKSLNVSMNKPKHTVFSNQPIKVTIKETTSKNKQHGQPTFNKNDGYKIVEAKAPNTNRQFTSNYEYSGIANSKNKSHTNTDNYSNAILNINKEVISKGRRPTDQGAKKSIGSKNINIIHKKQMSETTNRKPREGLKHIKYQDKVTISTFKDNLATQNRNEPELLDSLKDNPYVHSMQAFTFDEPVKVNKNIPTTYSDNEMMKEAELQRKIREEIANL